MKSILLILKANAGSYVSGEKLAEIAGMTRAGIWKQICRLREFGYEIESAPHKGYLLKENPLLLHPAEIKENLATKIFGQQIFFEKEIDSTNRWARALANEGAAEGTLVLAETQTRGRGRMGRNWDSKSGSGLWLSLILRPKISTSELACMTILTAVSMAEAVFKVTGIQLQIKWPNDLVYQGRKLAGILAELNGEMDLVNYLIIGIGLNVNQEQSDFPAELQEKAISLRGLRGSIISRTSILQEFLRSFEKNYLNLSDEVLKGIIDYAKANSATLGRVVTINQGYQRMLSGEAIDLDLDGSLWLRQPSGAKVKVYAGEIMEKTEEN